MGADLSAVTDLPGPVGATSCPVLLVHGWTGSVEDFGPVLAPLAERRRVLAPNLPGHGGAPPAADGDYSLGAHVRLLRGLLDDLELDEVHVVGHSHGGLVAQHLAAAASQRIRSMALIGSGLGALGEEMRATVARVATAAAEHGVAAAWQQVTGPDGAAGDPRAGFVEQRFLAMPVEAITGVARNLLTAEPLTAFLRGIDLPVLVCHGEGDRTWLPHEQRLLARSIAGAVHHVVPDALHSPAQENPEGLLAVLQPFLDAADARPPRRHTRPPTPITTRR